MRLSSYRVLDVQQTPPSTIPYGVHMIGAELEWPETQGQGIRVAVLDTGRPRHPDIQITGAVDFSGSDIYDRLGHGTHCCGIIAANGKIFGVAPKVSLYTVKILDDRGGGRLEWLVGGLNWCIRNDIDVVSMSLGALHGAEELERVIQDAYNAGIILVAAAGNEAQTGVSYPAAYQETIAVAAVDMKKEHADFSSVGPETELAAAGVDIYSTYLNGEYALLSGTSMACPHIAGAAALLQAKAMLRFQRKLTPTEMRTVMNIYAEDIGLFGKDNETGFGVFSFGRFGGDERVIWDLR